MDSSTILLSLPKELAEIKRQLISQQNELKLIEQAGREKTRLQFGESETTREGDDSRDPGRIVIDVSKPKPVTLNKYKSDGKQTDDGGFYQPQTAQYKGQNGTAKSAKTSSNNPRGPVRENSKKDLDSHNPTIFEIQRDENGALKVVTSKEDSNREKKMVLHDLLVLSPLNINHRCL